VLFIQSFFFKLKKFLLPTIALLKWYILPFLEVFIIVKVFSDSLHESPKSTAQQFEYIFESILPLSFSYTIISMLALILFL